MRLCPPLAILMLVSLGCPGIAAIPNIGNPSLDPAATFRVRDLQLNRGGVKIYLSEGVLSLFQPVEGRVTGAVFSTAEAESGDAEVLVLPPIRSERASLASYTGSPNLDEHLEAAVFFFADETVSQLRRQMEAGHAREAPELVTELTTKFSQALSQLASASELRMRQSLLDLHRPQQGFFYGVFFGKSLRQFDLLYDPCAFEPVVLGRGIAGAREGSGFEIWASYSSAAQTRTAAAPVNRFHSYRISATIASDLSLTAESDFDYDVSELDGRALRFDLSDRLRVHTASIDGDPVEVLQRSALQTDDARVGGAFLLIAPRPLKPGIHHMHIRYEGKVIRQTTAGTYFVDDRTDWFPQSPGLLSTFDLTFRCPADLRLVATGEPVQDEIIEGIRLVHRVVAIPRPFAGFNLGRYRTSIDEAGPYRIELYSNATLHGGREDLGAETARILAFYTGLWSKVPERTLSVSPISGYFGQGFPGLVYLAEAAFLKPEERELNLRNPRSDMFFSSLLLPHEIAHQWWGNLMFSSNYRSSWLIEALASYSCLQYIEAQHGSDEVQKALSQFRDDLLRTVSAGRTTESFGSLDTGFRLLMSPHPETWQPIVYGKGTWVLHMLRQRLGDRNFLQLERNLLDRFSQKPVTNEDLRMLAVELLPASPVQAFDPELLDFFATWVYSSGIPRLRLAQADGEWTLSIEGTEDNYSVDVPVSCTARGSRPVQVVIRATPGENAFPGGGKQFVTCSLPPASTFLSRQ